MFTLLRPVLSLALAAVITGPVPQPRIQKSHTARPAFLGFDTNLYPGDRALDTLRESFTFSGYWLNAPPGTRVSTWLGKRRALHSRGFGFLVLFNGRTDAQLRAAGHPAETGTSQGAHAVKLARKEGFPPRTIIFLDLEEGGRLLPEQRAYLHAWVDAVTRGGYRAGVYCSGIPGHEESSGLDVVTARDIRSNAGRRDITYFVADDRCPPSPGCVRPSTPPALPASGTVFAEVWQFAQSPRRKEYTSSCAATYAADGACYAPGKILVDLDVASSPDPSHGR
jgi:Domain of unknown function (DUF1906)